MKTSGAALLIARVKASRGGLELTDDGQLYLQLPPGNESLAAEIRAHKEQIRSLLRDRQNVRRPRQAPEQAPPPPEEVEPVYITPACRCKTYPFAHVHVPQPEPRDMVRFQDSDRMFDALKDLVTVSRNKDKEDESMKWFTSRDANLPEDQQGPEWLRTAAHDTARDTVYLSAGMSGDEDRTFLIARRDGVPWVADRGHTYVPARWLGKRYPEVRQDCEVLEQRISEAASTSK
jgi:hypothetical protein